MAIIAALAAVGTAALGVTAIRSPSSFKKNTLVTSLTTGDNSNGQSIDLVPKSLHSRAQVAASTASQVLAQVDHQYQQWIQTYLDPLFGDTRYQQLQEVTKDSGGLAISKLEITLNRNLALSSILTALAATTAWLAPVLAFPLCLPLALYLSWMFFQQTYYSLVVERRIKFNLLASVNLIALWIGGYFITGGLALILFVLGYKLTAITQDRSHKNLVNIFGTQPNSVWALVDGVEVEIPFEQIEAGDILIVGAGQMVPADGTILKGDATIDQHRLTGESQPVERSQGDPVMAATVVLAGRIQVQVEKAGQESLAAQIGEILNNTAGYQLSIDSKAQQLADQGVLPTLSVAALAYLFASPAGAIAITNASFGINARITGPLAMLNYLNIIAQRGILVKDGRSLELLHNIDTVVFDKTGTLTLEQPTVEQLHLFGDLSAPTLLAYAAAIEDRQSHPIARAIVAAAQEQDLALPPIDETRYEMGYGIQAQIDGHLIRIGSDRFMTMEEISLPAAVQGLQSQAHTKGHSLVMVAMDEELAGVIELKPTIRPEAKKVVADLHQRNVEIYIISGDQEEPTRTLAQELGIDHYFANTLPEDKAKLVEQLQNEERAVCFVGDGINDSIALKKANVSISLSGATTIATDTAQMVLMDSSLEHLPVLFDIGHEFNRNLQANLAMAVIPGLIICGGVFLVNLGVAASIMIYNLGLLAGVGIAMKPLVDHQKQKTGPETETEIGAECRHATTAVQPELR